MVLHVPAQSRLRRGSGLLNPSRGVHPSCPSAGYLICQNLHKNCQPLVLVMLVWLIYLRYFSNKGQYFLCLSFDLRIKLNRHKVIDTIRYVLEC